MIDSSPNSDALPIDEHFAGAVVAWYRSNKRNLPWRESADPYLIWISEVMLQQTRVDQMLPYYERFIQRFPDVHTLARADQHDVLLLWEGLGYYSRARNLHEAARTISVEFNGVIPDSWESILSLKGVGDYTAAAVLSIAYGKPVAVVDGNVIRLITRYLGITDDVRQRSTHNAIQSIVNAWIQGSHPADFNQGMMEIGSLICKPKAPLCDVCPLQTGCIARSTAQVAQIPYKSKKAAVPHHTIVVGIIQSDDRKVLIARRPEKAMLGGLWEFPGGKSEPHETLEDTLIRELSEELGVVVGNARKFHELKHAYSHFKITMHAFVCQIASGTPEPRSSQEIKWVSIDELHHYPFPKANRSLTEKLQKEYQDAR